MIHQSLEIAAEVESIGNFTSAPVN